MAQHGQLYLQDTQKSLISLMNRDINNSIWHKKGSHIEKYELIMRTTEMVWLEIPINIVSMFYSVPVEKSYDYDISCIRTVLLSRPFCFL